MGLLVPRRIALEGSSICQLKCPACPRFHQKFKTTIGYGFLQQKDFQKIIENNPGIVRVELSNYGELFLNPELLTIIKYAYENKIILTADVGVNFNAANESIIEGLVKYKYYSITCSIDGASNAQYSIYRRQGNFGQVIKNIQKINYFKKRYKSIFPLLTWQFVIFGHNEHEIPTARKMAQELGMRFQPKLSWDEDFSPIKDQAFVKSETHLPILSRKEYREYFGIDYMHRICHQLWDQPQINWDGKMLGCCRNFWSDFGGNVFEDGLSKCVNSHNMAYARAMVLGQKPSREDIPCSSCDIYLTMIKYKRFLKRDLKLLIKNRGADFLRIIKWRLLK
jgi:MoaA/NifB/PqqE/SkfB family radical SAM enzyme